MSIADGVLTISGAAGWHDVPFVRVARRAIREPLLHFLLLGALIFALGDLRGRSDQQYRIVIDDTRVAKLAQTYAQQFGGPPSPAMLRTLVDNYINEEVLYREGLAMRLDRDDEVIRRRVVQKVQFIEQDISTAPAPSDAALRYFYDSHQSRYFSPPHVTFTHVYFSPDKGGDGAARSRAVAVLASLNGKTVRAPERGDAYPDLYDYASIGPDDAARLFGQSPIARALFQLHVGRWSGPLRSGYGWHLVYVSAVEPSHLLPFAQIRDQVRADYQADAQTASNRRDFAALKGRYTIIREDGAGSR
jgi:hypothetical protein